MRAWLSVCAALVAMNGAALCGQVQPAPGQGAVATATDATDARALLEAALREDRIPEDRLDEVEGVFREASAREPGEGRWHAGLALAARMRGDLAGAIRSAEEAVRISPEDPEGHYQLGNASFATVGGASVLESANAIKVGREAYSTAIELDPGHVRSRFGLLMYYAYAPRVAGGSVPLAFEQAEELLRYPDGVYFGRLGHAMLASLEEAWVDMQRQYEAAVEAARNDDERRQAMTSHALSLMRRKHDYEAALPVIDRALTLHDADATLWHLRGESLRELRRWKDAAGAYERVLAMNEGAINARYQLGRCLEELGDAEGATRVYASFVERYPDDPRSDDARRRIENLAATDR